MRSLRTILYGILLALSSLSASAQTQILGLLNPGQSSDQPVLIIFNGESNSGGEGLNTSATTQEKSVNPSVRIINNNTLLLESLHIGVNNLLGHIGLSENGGDVTYHGWELQLGNRVAAGTFSHSPLFLAKTGQGGTTIENWADGVQYSGYGDTLSPWQAFKSRVDTAIAQIKAATGLSPRLFIFYSQGINNGTASTDWETKTIAHFQKIDARYGAYGVNGHVPKVMTKFFSPYGSFDPYIDDICATYGETYSVVTSDQPIYSTGNPHWTYDALKVICDRIISVLQTHYNF